MRLGVQGMLATDQNRLIRLIRQDNRRQTFFEFRQYFRVIATTIEQSLMYRVVIFEYEYKVLDSRQREVFAFHWHPASVSEATWPHVHVGSVVVDAAAEGMEGGFYERFSRLHVPTGMLAIEQVVRFLITELLVTPLRADWDAVLQEGEVLFQHHQPWLPARSA